MDEKNDISVEGGAITSAIMGANDASLMVAIFASQGEKSKIYVLLSLVAIAASLLALNLRLNYWSIALACLAWAASIFALFLSVRAMSGVSGMIRCYENYAEWLPYLAHGEEDKAESFSQFLVGIDKRNGELFQAINARGLSMRDAKKAILIAYGILLLSVNPAFFLF